MKAKKKRTSVFVKPENIITDSGFIRKRIHNKRLATLVRANSGKPISPLLCFRIKRKFYLVDGNERLKNILMLNKTGMSIVRVKVELL